jgi:SAM-dependent methyltransferase
MNIALTEYVIHDLNREPSLPYPRDRFDIVINTFSIDYVIDPAALFREVRRILKPNGLFLVIFTNRFFQTKAVKFWRDANDGDRVDYVRELFEWDGDSRRRVSSPARGGHAPRRTGLPILASRVIPSMLSLPKKWGWDRRPSVRSPSSLAMRGLTGTSSRAA